MSNGERLKKVKDLVESNQLEEAKKICKKYDKDIKLISCYINILMIEKNYKEAEKLCLDNIKYPPIASQYLSILIRQKNYKEAKEFCENYWNADEIAAQYVITLSELKENDKIKEVANRYPYNVHVAKSYAIHLMKNREYDNAIEVCSRHLYDESMKTLLDEITLKKSIDNNSGNMKLNITNRVSELMSQKRYKEAKNLLKPYLDDESMFELYLVVSEHDRVNNLKL